MFCPNCGTDLPENASFCPECGNRVTITKEQVFSQEKETQYNSPFDNGTYPGENYGYPYEEPVNPNAGKVDFKTAIKLFFQNYANFETRSTKTEYWWAFLFNLLVSSLTSSISFSGGIAVISSVVSVVLLIPGLAVTVRRLHDTGKSWTYILINLIPLVGWIFFIIQLCKDSDEDNRWGPKAR